MIEQNVMSIRRLWIVRRGTPVLTDVDLDVRRGLLVGMLGPSGSGKTTLMRAIVGLQRIAAGTIDILGMPAGAATLRHRIAYTTQSPSVYADLTVTENLEYFARILGVSRDEVDRVVATVRLDDHARHVVARLSGGERARVSLALALLGDADLLVLDEPTVGLDPLLRRELWRTFRDLAAAGTTLLVSSHVLDEAEACDDIVLLRDGRILATGTPAELKRRTGTTSVDDAFVALVEGGRAVA